VTLATRCSLAALLALAVAVAAPQSAFAGGPIVEGRTASAALPGVIDPVRQTVIVAEPVDLLPAQLSGLAPAGAWVLKADDPAFGGLSGLDVEAEGLVWALTDEGRLLRFGPLPPPGEAGRSDAAIFGLWGAHLRDESKISHDAEAMTVLRHTVWVAFERRHRIEGASEGVEPIVLPEFGDLEGNAGIEALATVEAASGEALLAITEGTDEAGARGFAISPDGRLLAEGRLPQVSRHLVTGADVGPDGRLYMVLRHWSPQTGVSIRIRRYALAGEPPLPDPGSIEELGAFERYSGIDNMEGIALWQDETGATHLTIVADDNFSPLQRTVLADFVVTP